MKIIKILILVLLFIGNYSYGQLNSSNDVEGLFLSVGVGPRFPIGDLNTQQTIGAGFDVVVSFTHTSLYPLFYYAKIGYQNHPGDYDFYKTSDHSSISTNIISFHGGGRYYFSPMIEDEILLMPFLEGGVSYAYIDKYHQYKIDSSRKDNLENLSKLGFHIGGGLSFFLMDIMGSYNHFSGNQYFSFDLRLTIPLAVTI